MPEHGLRMSNGNHRLAGGRASGHSPEEVSLLRRRPLSTVGENDSNRIVKVAKTPAKVWGYETLDILIDHCCAIACTRPVTIVT